MSAPPVEISARDNPLIQRLRKLTQDPAAYRKLGQVWLEGEHLCSALLARGGRAQQAVIARSAWMQRPALRTLAEGALRCAIVEDKLFAQLSGLESPAALGMLIETPAAATARSDRDTLVLDRVQDAGNVGSMLRSAAALGIGQVLALKGTAALWSPKVLRAGQGAHFGLRLAEGLAPEDLAAMGLPLVATSPHAEAVLGRHPLPRPLAWVLGHEGQGVQPALLQACALTLRIPQPGGEESLNVAAAAAICFYESQVRSRA